MLSKYEGCVCYLCTPFVILPSLHKLEGEVGRLLFYYIQIYVAYYLNTTFFLFLWSEMVTLSYVYQLLAELPEGRGKILPAYQVHHP